VPHEIAREANRETGTREKRVFSFPLSDPPFITGEQSPDIVAMPEEDE
jgi:hypothetical protein